MLRAPSDPSCLAFARLKSHYISSKYMFSRSRSYKRKTLLVLLCFSFLYTACAKFPDINLCKFDGSGTEADPYILCDYADLTEKLQDSVNLSAHFVMYADIDARESWSQGTAGCTTPFDGSNEAAADCEGWEPVGSLMGSALCSDPGASCFTGTFNGRGHAVSNVWIKRDDEELGFFGAVTAPSPDAVFIHDIALIDVHINGGNTQKSIGGLVGWQQGGDITNSYAMGMVDGGAGSDRPGGLVGVQQSGNILNSYATGAINGGDGSDRVGGLVGLQQSGGDIENSYATGVVNGEGGTGQQIGGLVGEQSGGDIESSYATGAVNGENGTDFIGGLVGRQNGGTIRENSYAAKGVLNGRDGDDRIGGLVGWQNAGTIENSYAVMGVINGGAGLDQVGGLVGDQDGDITNSYATGEVNGEGDSDNAG